MLILHDFTQSWFNMTSTISVAHEAYVVLSFRLFANTTAAIKLTSAHLVTLLTALSAIMQF